MTTREKGQGLRERAREMATEVVQIQNLGHDHPLMLIKPEETDDSWDLSIFCYGCEEPISISSSSSSYYSCERCMFFLHKTCAELPHEMTHPCHPQHPVTLLPNPPTAGHSCDVCTKYCNSFIYRCSLCDYDIDLKCAFEVLSIQIQNLGHDHPLMLIKPEETDDSWDLSFFCYGCEEPISISSSSSYYGCKQCSFFLHKTCTELPHEMIHPCHPQHPLTLLPNAPRAVHKCDVCTAYCNGFIYCCSLCDYDIDLKCAFEVLSIQIQNLGHDHPLMLIKPEETDDSWDLSCYGCEQPILISSSSSYYGCKRCRFFLHKSCAKLPHEMTHPSHPQHPLTLLPNPPPHYKASHAECDVCLEHFNRFTYHCSLCKYNIDLKCALEVLGIQMSNNHPSHAHQLIPLQKESSFLCDACGIQHKGTSYLCPTCGFWINQKCASSPLTLELNNHPHTLTLVYLVPQEEYLHARPHCQICSERIYRRNWVYRCSRCHYYLAHLHCAVSDKEHSTNNESENEIHDHGLNPINHSSRNSATPTSDADLVIYLPMPDDSTDIITQFIKNTAIQGKHKEAAKIKHGSHDHPLSLFEKPTDHAFLNGARKDEKCFGCTQSISAPFYHCDQCEFFLHVWCAELPEKLRHQGHPQHTLFLNKVHAQCACCRLSGNIFFYECIQSQCNFYLDCKCASLPRVIKHESHDKHTLALRPTSFSSTCTSCGVRLRISFECLGCNFNLCVRCAILPCTVRHRYDKHPFTLTYSLLPYQIEDDFCELCEEGIDSNRWFYHCGECNQYLHRDCILPVDKFSNIVYEQWINSRKHQHQLIYVKPNPNSSCSLCGRKIANAKSYFCPPCGFRLCLFCTQKEIHDLCLNRIDLSSSNSATATLDADLYKVIYLPVPDDSVDIISQFIKNTAIQGKKHKEEAEIKHDSHHHPLTLFEKPIDHALSPLNGARNDEKCNGCAQSISAPFYHCVICKFFLHVWCAELPEELRHPGHPQHTLFLSKVNHVTKCRCCNLVGNVFFYECTECDFYLDSKCASLPRVIKHESHDKHTLALRPTPFSSVCTSCGIRLRISFECLGCKFNLCVRCAILPRTLWHRYDQFSNMVYAQWINSRTHLHRLISVKPNPNTSCSLCKRNNANADSYWCPPCGFRLCSSCRQKEIQGEN